MHFSLVRIAAFSALVFALSGFAIKSPAQTHDSQVLFVCQHRNVKSLMAASYFNQLAQGRRLPYTAVSRGTASNSTNGATSNYAGPAWRRLDVSSFIHQQ